MRLNLILILFVGISLKGFSQSISSNAVDTLLFRECFCGDILRTDLGLMKAAFDFIDMPRKVTADLPGYTYTPSSSDLGAAGLVSSKVEMYGSLRSMFKGARASGFDERIMNAMYSVYGKQHPAGFNLDSVKADLVARLERFDTLATVKPLFYSDIHGKYKGDIVRYVDDLYDKSMMGNLKRLKYFFRNPRKKIIQNDLGYQFSLGLVLYEQWIVQLRNGKVEE